MPEEGVIDTFATGYHDQLQLPLQPLMNNLESSTYEVFEQDPVKYTQYEKAIYNALIDAPKKRTVLMVVGAGRGPLVDRALKAADESGSTVKIYVVEKNPNAILTYLKHSPRLRKRQKTVWANRDLEVFHTDMRFWTPPEQCDILVSELLGSFGDNELSPECLDGAEHLIKGKFEK